MSILGSPLKQNTHSSEHLTSQPRHDEVVLVTMGGVNKYIEWSRDHWWDNPASNNTRYLAAIWQGPNSLIKTFHFRLSLHSGHPVDFIIGHSSSWPIQYWPVVLFGYVVTLTHTPILQTHRCSSLLSNFQDTYSCSYRHLYCSLLRSDRGYWHHRCVCSFHWHLNNPKHTLGRKEEEWYWCMPTPVWQECV